MSHPILDTVLGVTANCCVFAYFLFAPFRTRFRHSYAKTALMAAALTAFTAIVSAVFFVKDTLLSDYFVMGIVLWLVCAVLTFRLAIKGSFFEILFIVLVILNLYVNIAAVSKVIMGALSIAGTNTMAYSLFRIVILIACIPLIWVLLGKLFRQVVEFGVDFPFWKFIWVIPALMYLIFLTKIAQDYWRYPVAVNSMDIAFMLLWAFTTYAVFCVTLLMLIQSYQSITARQQTELMAAQLKMEESQYEKLLAGLRKTDRLRHDWRHHLLSISGFAETGRIAELQKYVSDLAPSYLMSEDGSVCQNHIVDVILQYNMARAREQGIAVTATLELPKQLSLAETDLCVIFGNLVENALEACAKQSSGEKTIEISARLKGEQLALSVRNTYEGAIVCRNGVYYSTKHEGVGIGLSSVCSVVKKHNGILRVDYDETHFRVRVLLDVDP